MKLDGSYGEGGGQILRTAIALSAITGESVEISNIRKMRPKPGLAAQHVKAVECVASICNAKVKGCSIGSTVLSFSPGEIKGGEYRIDIGTAGSITLLLQCLMPVALHAPDAIRIKISGGTDVSWSPSIDYLRFVTLHALSKMGCNCHIKLIRRGYYPRGGGCVEAIIHPSTLKPVSFEMRQSNTIQGISHSSNLPAHVVERQANSAKETLQQQGYDANIQLEMNNYPSTGSGITLWCDNMGGSALGKPGVRAEKVGKEAAEALLHELNSGAGVDVHLADQLVPYIAIAKGSFTTRMITSHTKTNIWVSEQFLDVKFKIEKVNNHYRVYV